jgi:hypothetical protein
MSSEDIKSIETVENTTENNKKSKVHIEDKIRQLLTTEDVSNNSINLYIDQLRRLAYGKTDKQLNNLSYLKDTDKIMEKISKYAINTQKAYLTALSSILKSYSKSNKSYASLYDTYKGKLYDITKNNKTKINEKTETQSENWMSWDEVLSIKDKLKSEVDKFEDEKKIDTPQYETLLKYITLSLYTDNEPRRNTDYQLLYVVKDNTDLPNDKNYLDMKNKQFIFNVYKTVKHEGKKVLNISDDLFNKIKHIYFKFHPLIKGKLGKISNKEPIRFLVYEDGTALDKINSLTRLLNKIFNRNVGSSMLRNIYISYKYGDMIDKYAEMEQTASNMSHTLPTQRYYMKKSKKKDSDNDDTKSE